MGILNSGNDSSDNEGITETYQASADAMYKHATEDPQGFMRILGNVVGAIMELRELDSIDATHKAALDAVAIIIFEFAEMTLETFSGDTNADSTDSLPLK